MKDTTGKHRCDIKGCKRTADTSVLMLLMTFGGRQDRKKASSGAQHLCWECLTEIAKALPASQLKAGIGQAIARLQGGA